MKNAARLFLGLFMGIAGNLYAQFIPNNNQAFQFMSLYNPGFTGVESFGDLKLSYRYQWTGFGADAPKFINLAYNMRLRQPLDLTQNALRTSNAISMRPENLPKSKGTIHGFGANVFNESVGQVERIGGGVNYSLNYSLSKKIRMAGGIAVLIENTRIDLNKLVFREPDSYYQSLVDNGSSQTTLSLRAGLLLYSPGFYFGVSYLPVWTNTLQSANTAVNDPFYVASAQVGVAIPFSPTFSVKPSILALMDKSNEFQIDYSVKAYIQEKVWFGFSYRDIQSGVVMLGFTISDTFCFSYSFEFSTSGYKQFSDGSHEVTTAIRLNNVKRKGQYIW
ncbi:MAG: PorP/SprF family type IX secretion system membrane protein [Cyclobacteriaceae bacterium]|nr:PorP/SprF family type IX secretion system membrane protein [Cyclobacteriaceae bacterium]